MMPAPVAPVAPAAPVVPAEVVPVALPVEAPAQAPAAPVVAEPPVAAPVEPAVPPMTVFTEALDQMIAMGFDAEPAAFALNEVNGDVTRAVNRLMFQ